MKQIIKKVLIINLIFVLTLCTTSINVAKAAEGKNMVSNCSHGEAGHGVSGGVAGDQDGEEYKVRTWYDFSINHVLRYKDPQVAAVFAELAVEAANNDNIGYDQGERTTFWQQLQVSNYRPSQITTPCEADCSASTIAIVKATGYLLDIKDLQQLDINGYTGSMLTPFINCGFTDYTDRSYTHSPDLLQPGDVLLNTSSHVNIFVGDGVAGSSGAFVKFDIDDVTINLDDQEFEFAGTPQTVTYTGEVTAGEWVFTRVSQFVDFIVAVITNGIKMSVLGWAMSLEGAVNKSIKFVEGN